MAPFAGMGNPKGLFADFHQHPIFGFNNPAPSAERKAYGYELWIRVAGPEVGEKEAVFKEFEGGFFAMTPCRLQGDPDIGSTWRMLWDWAQVGPYRWSRSQELEKVINPNAAENETGSGAVPAD